MKYGTLSTNSNHIEGWTISTDEIERSMQGHYIQSAEEIKPCGCGIKQSLKHVVYPALKQCRFSNIRVDADVQDGQFQEVKRIILSRERFLEKKFSLLPYVKDFGPNTIIELYSTSTSFLKQSQKAKEEFLTFINRKSELIQEINQYQREKSLENIAFGKGHTIIAGGDIVMLDFIKTKKNALFSTISNNDTIVTADSLIKTTCMPSVFTALNNSLNDLYVHGVCDKLKIFPCYAVNSQSKERIEELISDFIQFHKERGVEIEDLHKEDRLINQSMNIIGATSIGETDRQPISLSNLTPGDKVIVTKPLGDLAFLALYRSKYFTSDKLNQADYQKRLNVLQTMTTSNYLISKIIKKYRPKKNESFNRSKHINVVTDISGPGLQVLEEAAQLSKVNLRIKNINFKYQESLRNYRRNYTTSTNGALVISAHSKVIENVHKELESIGLKEVWELGEILEKSDNPKIDISESAIKSLDMENIGNPFFTGKLKLSSGEELNDSLFQSYRFV